MITCYDIIKTLVHVTEKGADILKLTVNIFLKCARDSNKIEIKKAVEEIYKVKVQDVNTTYCSW